MSVTQSKAMDRRHALGALALPAVGLTLPRMQRGRAITQRGMVGGGTVEVENGEAQFSVFASRLTFDDGSEVVLGSVRWVDASAGVEFQSVEIHAYDVLPDPSEGGELRRVTGTMRDSSDTELPFTLNLLDAGTSGETSDSVALVVGDGAINAEGTPVSGAGFTYAVAGNVLGDLQEVGFDIEGTNVIMVSGTPAP